MLRVLPLSLLVLATGCLHRDPVPTQGPECGAAPGEHARWLGRGGVLIIGELHGTAEIPAAVGRLACLASQSNETIVALELPVNDRAAVARYLESGSEREILDSAFWSGAEQDGRSSVAMLELLRSLRALRSENRRLEVALFAPGAGETRGHEQAMAAELAELHQQKPSATLLVLVGRTHARKSVGAPWDSSFKPMAWHLTQVVPETKSVLVTHTRGSAWVCCKPDHCAPHDYDGSGGSGSARFLEDNSQAGFDGQLFLGSIQASPPAISTRP